MKPVIGITCASDEMGINLKRFYYNAVYHAGGLPLLIPLIAEDEYIEDVLNKVDGLVITGGGDINPKWYSENNDFSCEICNERDSLEISLAKKALNIDMPILGICRGHQVLNVAFGGSLYQDIEKYISNALDHRRSSIEEFHHEVEIEKDTLLYEITGKTNIFVNTYHHQSVKKVAEGFSVSARSKADGVVEAIEKRDKKFVLGVQWHPERMYHYCEINQKIFNAFVKSCL